MDHALMAYWLFGFAAGTGLAGMIVGRWIFPILAAISLLIGALIV
jgi:hypothetical protein